MQMLQILSNCLEHTHLVTNIPAVSSFVDSCVLDMTYIILSCIDPLLILLFYNPPFPVLNKVFIKLSYQGYLTFPTLPNSNVDCDSLLLIFSTRHLFKLFLSKSRITRRYIKESSEALTRRLPMIRAWTRCSLTNPSLCKENEPILLGGLC